MENHFDFPSTCGTLRLHYRAARPLTEQSTTSPLARLRKLGVARLSCSNSMDLDDRATLMQGRMISLLFLPISWRTSKRMMRFVVNILKSRT